MYRDDVSDTSSCFPNSACTILFLKRCMYGQYLISRANWKELRLYAFTH